MILPFNELICHFEIFLLSKRLNFMRLEKIKSALFGFLIMVFMLTSSCANTKRDCQGHKKHRMANGAWI